MLETFRPYDWNSVTLRPGLFRCRFDLNRAYLVSLSSANLLQNYYLEAGLWDPSHQPHGCHWGWESPTCQLRGHFLGHWLSAAAKIYAGTGDAEVKGKADFIVSELGRCQRENGGEWLGSIPERYLDWIACGKKVWAPHYTLHKTLMGLYEMYALAGNEQALEILDAWAKWFHRWTGRFSRAQMDDILDVETGGMLEVWANLYGVTGKQEHLDLLQRYDRPRFFDRLLVGEDVLTDRHANTTIPEVHGAARAWEVTGDRRWRAIVDAYWRMAVAERGFFCTGGQTNGEDWTPPGQLSGYLGSTNQEHCVVYNMMRLADWLLRWTGDAAYADYWERNLYNGILAQQHPDTGMVTYYLPLQAGAVKHWGTPTDDFWCCHGTLVEAHAMHGHSAYFEDADGLIVSQYMPSELRWAPAGATVRVSQTTRARQFQQMAVDLTISCDRPTEFTLKLRLPSWVCGEPVIEVNGQRQSGPFPTSGFHSIRRVWTEETISVALPRRVTSVSLPGDPSMVAFMDGPVVLAGLCDEELTLRGDKDTAERLLRPHDRSRRWEYRTDNQTHNIHFVPLYEVREEPYTVYFPLE